MIIIGEHIMHTQNTRAFARSIERVIRTFEAQPAADMRWFQLAREAPPLFRGRISNPLY